MQAAGASVLEKVRRNGGSASGRPGVAKRGPRAPVRSGAKGAVASRNRSASGRKKLPASVDGARRSTHVVIARIDPVSVLKLSALFYLSLSLALFIAGVLIWTTAQASGLIGNIESFMDELGFTDFRLQTSQLLGASVLASAVLVAAGSVANLLMALLYNLLGDVVGGLKVVLDQDRDKPKG